MGSAVVHAGSRLGLSGLTAVRAAEMVIGGIVFLLLIEASLQFSLFDGAFWARYDAFFEPGLYGSLHSIALAMPISLLVGFLAGWARISRYRVLSWPSTLYVDFFRGVPPLVLVIFAFLFGASFIPGPIHDRFFAGMSLQAISVLMAGIAIALHSGAYQAEIFRAGFQSIPKGQQEAAQALGMTSWQSMRFVILPQTFRLSLPPLGNELAVLIKDTSLLAVISGGTQLLGGSGNFIGTLAPQGLPLTWMFAVWSAVAIVYFAMTFSVTRVLLILERRFHTPGLEAVSI